MAVVVQPAFRIEVLALEAQRIVDFVDIEAGNLAVGAVVRRPDDFTVWVCKLLRCSEVVELVVEGWVSLGPKPSSSASGRKLSGS